MLSGGIDYFYIYMQPCNFHPDQDIEHVQGHEGLHPVTNFFLMLIVKSLLDLDILDFESSQPLQMAKIKKDMAS